MITLAIAAAFAMSVPPPTVTAVPDARPAVWVVRDDDTTVYLFGTFHALDGKSNWFNGEVRSAFNEADEIVLETVVPEAPAAMPRERVAALLAEPIKPGSSFMASTRLALSVGKSKGLSFSQGADAIIRNAARYAGKKVSGLESFDEQLSMFARLGAEGARAPSAGDPIDPVDNLATVMATMQASWKRGEGEIFAGMLEDMRNRSPANYRTLFVERNAQWAEWIARRLDTPGTVFVAVGAGHLAGSDSVQNKLGILGVRATRVR